MKKISIFQGKKPSQLKCQNQSFKMFINYIHLRHVIVAFVKLISYLKSASHEFETLRLNHYLTQSLRLLEQEKEIA